MPRCRVYQKPEGGVAVVSIVERGRRQNETDGEAFARIVADYDAVRAVAREAPVAGQPYVEIDEADLPAQRGEPLRRLRDAWRVNGHGVVVDLPTARTRRITEIRAERDARFAHFDAEWTKAMGRGDVAGAAAIDAQRERLRVVPQVATTALSNTTTPAAVLAYEPEWPE